MNNWRLLLLALIAVSQPIASFTERNVFHGKQCCDRQVYPLLRSTDGSFRSTESAAKDVRLSRDEIRGKRQLETTVNRRSAKIDQRRTLDSASQYQRQLRISRITTENQREVYYYPLKNRNRDSRAIGFDNRRFNREHYIRNTARHQYERKSRDSRNGILRDEMASPRLGSERIGNKITIRDERSGYEFQEIVRMKETRVRNEIRRERSDRSSRRSIRLGSDRIGNKITIQDERSGYGFQETVRMKEMRERNEIRRERSDRSIRRSFSNVERRVNLKGNIRASEIMERRSNLERLSGDNFIRSKRSVSLPNTRINSNNINRYDQIRANRRLIADRVDERRYQRNEHRMAKVISTIQNQNEAYTRKSIQESLEDQRHSGTIQNNKMNNQMEASQSVNTRRMSMKRTTRALINHYDNDTNRRIRSNERTDFRSRAMKLTRSSGTSEVSRTRENHEIRERAIEPILRKTVDERFENLKSSRILSIFNVYQQQEHKDHKAMINWQTVLYMLQAIYLCSLFLQMINLGNSETHKSRNLSWWTPTSVIKVD